MRGVEAEEGLLPPEVIVDKLGLDDAKAFEEESEEVEEPIDSSTLITSEMIEEERKLEEVRQQQWLEEQRKMKPTPKEEKQRKFDMLGELLRKAGVYTDFLKSRIEEARKNTDQHTSTDTKRKRKAGSPSPSGKAARTDDDSTPGGRVRDPRQPELVTGAVMYDYQVDGVQWLIGLYENGMNGILADEMGLGKTIQSIGVLAHLWSKEVYGPFLIVGPLTVMTNWHNEFKKFTPEMPCILYHGSKADRAALRAQYLKNAGQKTFPIVITTFEIAMIDRKELQRFTWKYLVVDEGHRLKNKDCRLMRELQALKTENRLLLTGTPLQNNLTELWSLLHFTLPAIFQDLETFKNWFNFDEAMGEGGEGQEKIMEDQKEHQLVTKLHAILDPFLLRRLKTDVGLSLPKKKEVIVYTSLTKQQKAYYEGLLAKDRSLLEKVQGTLGDAESWSGGSGASQSQSLQNILMQLRKCCNHPFLFQFPMTVNDEPIVDERIVSYCGKLVLLDKMLKHFKANGHKVLIFCQMTKMMDILEDFMELRGYRYCRIDGGVQHSQRQGQIDAFNSDKDILVFILSTRAGGLGINLVSADTCIIYDSDWNPQQDIQAQARCHRIGQTKDVAVYRLVTVGTVEERIVQRAQNKRKLELLVINRKQFKGDHTAGKSLTLMELAGLLSLDMDESAKKPISDGSIAKLLDRQTSLPSTGPGWEEIQIDDTPEDVLL